MFVFKHLLVHFHVSWPHSVVFVDHVVGEPEDVASHSILLREDHQSVRVLLAQLFK